MPFIVAFEDLIGGVHEDFSRFTLVVRFEIKIVADRGEVKEPERKVGVDSVEGCRRLGVDR